MPTKLNERKYKNEMNDCVCLTLKLLINNLRENLTMVFYSPSSTDRQLNRLVNNGKLRHGLYDTNNLM